MEMNLITNSKEKLINRIKGIITGVGYLVNLFSD